MKNSNKKNDTIKNEIEIDEIAYKKKNIFAAIILFPFFGILFFGSLMTSIIPLTGELSINKILIYSLISIFLAGLSILVLSLIQKTNLNGLEYFNNVYFSGERIPLHSWEYTDDKWKDFAIKKYDYDKKEHKIIFKILIGMAIAACILLFHPAVIAIFLWIITIGFILFFFRRKKHLVIVEAYFHTEPVTIDFYDKGLVISQKHYVPFNMYHVYLKNIKFIKKEGILYLEIVTNNQPGKYLNQYNASQLFPVPTDKEHEESKIRSLYKI